MFVVNYSNVGPEEARGLQLVVSNIPTAIVGTPVTITSTAAVSDVNTFLLFLLLCYCPPFHNIGISEFICTCVYREECHKV